MDTRLAQKTKEIDKLRIAGPEGSSEPARWRLGELFLDDRRLLWLQILLDEAFVVPGTAIRFGLDGLIGFVPGLGDVLAGLLSLIIPLAAWVRGVPYITLVRMFVNISIGMLVGTVPIFGDAFDIFWKANRRNYRLLLRSVAEPRRHTWRDWGFLLLLAAAIALVFTLPLAFTIWLLTKFAAALPMR